RSVLQCRGRCRDRARDLRRRRRPRRTGDLPISTLRNRAAEVSKLLGLPDHVFPVAGLGVGWPSFAGVMSPRLGLDVTVHHDRYDEKDLQDKVAAYDKRRRAVQPYASQRHVDKYGEDPEYGWSEDKV